MIKYGERDNYKLLRFSVSKKDKVEWLLRSMNTFGKYYHMFGYVHQELTREIDQMNGRPVVVTYEEIETT